MAGYNLVVLLGNITRDFEVRYTPSGVPIGTTSLAVNTSTGKKNNGTLYHETLFIDLVIFGKLAESLKDYMKKGKSVLVQGRLRYRTWEDPSGNKRSKHEVVVNSVQLLTGGKVEKVIEEDDVSIEEIENEDGITL